MRHVTDGELHAFLDGALDLLPGGRGEEVREHVSGCPACRERLQDEELVRSLTGKILGNPDFDDLSLPTFEELRERAEALGSDGLHLPGAAAEPVHYRGPMRGLPIAWAATIVLALGVGWMGGQVWHTLPGPGGLASGPAPAGESVLRSADRESVLSEAGEPQLSRLDTRALPAQSAAEEVAGAPPPSTPVPEAIVEVRQSLASREADASAQQSDSILRKARSPEAGLMMDLPAAAEVLESPLYPSAGAGNAVVKAEDLENSLVLKGLGVVSIGWEERVAGERALLIRQLLSPGDTLELRYLGMLLGTDPGPQGEREGVILADEAARARAYANVLAATLPAGWNQVVMERGRWLLVARAPISEESLKTLLKTLY